MIYQVLVLATFPFLPLPEGLPRMLDRCSFGEGGGEKNQHLKWSKMGYWGCEQRCFGWQVHYRCSPGEVRWPEASPKSHLCHTQEGFLETQQRGVALPTTPFALALKVKVVERLRGGPGLPGHGEQAPHCAAETALWPLSMEDLTARFYQLSTSAHAKIHPINKKMSQNLPMG